MLPLPHIWGSHSAWRAVPGLRCETSFLRLYMFSAPLLWLWPPSGTNHLPWPSRAPLPFSMFPTHPVRQHLLKDKPCTLGSSLMLHVPQASLPSSDLSPGLHVPLSKWLWASSFSSQQAPEDTPHLFSKACFFPRNDNTVLSDISIRKITK